MPADIIHARVSASVISPQIRHHDLLGDPIQVILATRIDLEGGLESIHLQVHCPEGQAQEVPQLQEHPGPGRRLGQRGFLCPSRDPEDWRAHPC